MAGANLYYAPAEARKTFSSSFAGPCVFISHRKIDLAAAKGIAQFLQIDVGVNIYFDANDASLGVAAASGDDRRIVECLERGIEVSTHLIGVLSSATRDSWWVPFEIGSARRKGAKIGYALLEGVDNLPSYLRISRLIASEKELRDWALELRSFSLWAKRASGLPPNISGLSRERSSSSVKFRNAA
jgi:hypothetical protein